MFRCQKCKKVSQPYTKPIMVAVRTRQVDYPCGTKGTEIAEEKMFCSSCAKAFYQAEQVTLGTA